MPRDFLAFVGRLSAGRVLLLGLFCAVIMEAVTAALRFGMDLQVTRDTGPIGGFTYSLRIHHGYMGLVLLPIAFLFRPAGVRKLLLIIAIGLILSDLFHHFLVLWPLTGSPHFDLFYPRPAVRPAVQSAALVVGCQPKPSFSKRSFDDADCSAVLSFSHRAGLAVVRLTASGWCGSAQGMPVTGRPSSSSANGVTLLLYATTASSDGLLLRTPERSWLIRKSPVGETTTTFFLIAA